MIDTKKPQETMALHSTPMADITIITSLRARLIKIKAGRPRGVRIQRP